MRVCQHAKDIPGRRARSLRPVLNMRESGMQFVEGRKNYPDEDFFRHNDPWESVIFPAFPEIQKMQKQEAYGVDP